MSDSADYRRGRRDGLLEAFTLLAKVEAKLAEREGTGKARQTRIEQRVRRKAVEVARTRVQTALNARERQDRAKGDSTQSTIINAALARLGL